MTLGTTHDGNERLISADSHVNLTHDVVKQHLAARYHEPYDAAVAAFQARVFEAMGGAGAANQAMMRDESGRKVLELIGVRLKRVAREDLLLLREAWSEWLYEVKWQAREVPPPSGEVLPGAAPWIICLDKRGLGERLAAGNVPVGCATGSTTNCRPFT